MRQVMSRHDGDFRMHRKTMNSDKNIYEQLQHTIMNDVRGILRQQHNNVKYYITCKFVFEKADRPGVYTDPPIYVSTEPIATTRSRPIEDILRHKYEELVEKIETFVQNGSGWILKEILDVDLRIVTYDPTRASSYLKLPGVLHKSHSILNIYNKDNKCVLWCILARLFPKYKYDGRSRENNIDAYIKYEQDIDIKDIEFPLKIQLERWNSLAINVFSIDKFSKLIPLRISEENVSDDHLIDLLYIVNEENSHYCLITNIHGLLRSQSSHGNNSKYLCRRCLHFCRRE